MALIRPRLTDFHGIFASQSELDFAIPFFEEDIPLYVDPFLLWRSPSQQDQALHTSLINSLNRQNWLIHKGRADEALQNLISASECDEVGFGVSAKRKGKRIGPAMANQILDLFRLIPEYRQFGFAHFEEIQLYIDGFSKDRISDIACSFLKSFLIDYTIEQCLTLGIPLAKVRLETLHDYKSQTFRVDVEVEPTRAHLDLLDEDDLPQNSDVVLMLGQAVAAMEAFKGKYHRYVASAHGHTWVTKDNL